MIKACENCKWYRYGEGCVQPCVNEDSDNYGEIMFAWNYCEEWENGN